tara:strand:+ start:9311 stop:10276 length:966 start_codon:yes stop_codon:yes gene_type:complete
VKVVISFDFELAWGVADSYEWEVRERSGLYDACHAELPAYIRLLEEMSVPVTWAIVSNLLNSETGHIQTEHLKGRYRESVESFLHCSKPTSRSAVDLIKQVVSFEQHEIATHTATHPYPSHCDIDEDVYMDDVRISLDDIGLLLGRVPTNIVYPRDEAHYHKAIAKKFGLGARINPKILRRSNLPRILKYTSEITNGAPPSRVMLGMSGEVLQTGSALFNWYGGRAAFVKRFCLKAILRKILISASEPRMEKDIYHLWLHPFNLLRDRAVGDAFKCFLIQADGLRKKGLLEFITMNQCGQELLAESDLHKNYKRLCNDTAD